MNPRLASLCVATLVWFGRNPVSGQPLTPGNALSLNGDHQTVSVSHSPPLNAFPLTVSAWINTSQNVITNTSIVNKYVAGSFNGYQLALKSGNLRAFYMVNLGNNIYGGGDGLDGGFVADGNWHHVAFVVDAGGGALYVDGVQKTSLAWNGPPAAPTTSQDLNIGRYPQGAGGGIDSWYQGIVDEVQIWNVALPISQIRSNMNRSLFGTEAGLVAYYRFDETSGTVATNSSSLGAGFNGSWQGTPTRVGSGVPFVPGVLAATASQLSLAGTAQLDSQVVFNGTGANVWFEWGTTTNYGSRTPLQALPSSSDPSDFNAIASGLLMGQLYHFRAAASNSFGLNYSADQTLIIRATNIVTSLADGVVGSLRRALALSVINGGRVEFTVTGSLVLTNEIVVDKSITIAGPGAAALALNGNKTNRIFTIKSGATVLISGLSLTNGQARNGSDSTSIFFPGGDGEPGGAIYNAGSLILNNCFLMRNSAGNGGYAQYSLGGQGGKGGAIYNGGTLTINSCRLIGNLGGNAVYLDPATPSGGGTGGAVHNAGTLFVLDSDFDSNLGGNGGSGLSGAAGGGGGGLFNSGIATLSKCTFHNNAGGNGGIASLTAGGGGGGGGGIYNSGVLTLTLCTLDENRNGEGSPGSFASPAAPDGKGGNIENGSGSTTIIASTITRAFGGGGLFNGSAKTNCTVYNSIVAGNTNANFRGLFTSLGHNFIGWGANTNGFTNGVNFDLVGTSGAPIDPMLASLTNNGGLTWTRALLPGSRALESGDDALLLPPYSLITDQRDAIRRSGPHIDIGAFELDRLIWPLSSVTTLAVSASASTDPGTGSTSFLFNASLNPGAVASTLQFQFGTDLNYGGLSLPLAVGSGTNLLQTNLLVSGFSAGALIQYRAVLTNVGGIYYGANKFILVPLLHPPGDVNGDNIVDQGELSQVLSNYWTSGPGLVISNPTATGRGNFQFGLADVTNLNFTVMVSTNLFDWSVLTTVTPAFQFADLPATNAPQRFYRLRWP